MNDFLNDIDAMLAAPKKELTAADMPTRAERGVFEQCPKCRGTGRTRWGQCFRCKGAGGRTFKSSSAARAKNRERAAERKASREQERWEDFKSDHPEIAAWMDRNPTFAFAASLREAVSKYGDLSNNQIDAARRCIAREVEREEQRRRAKAEAPTVNVSAVQRAFDAARANKVASPRMRIGTFKLSCAPAHGSNPGAIYVKDEDIYIGKVADGKFFAVQSCSVEQASAFIAAAEDPKAAAVAYGRRTSTCSICGRGLTNGVSIDMGIGPICASRFGW